MIPSIFPKKCLESSNMVDVSMVRSAISIRDASIIYSAFQ